MAITYPLSTPNDDFATLSLNQKVAIGMQESPYNFEQDVDDWGGQMWTGTVTLSNLSTSAGAEWEGWLAALNGPAGTFLMGDSSRSSPRGTASSGTVTGSAGSSSVTVAMTGTLLRGDMIQIGTGSDATLHIVTADRSGNGTMEIWPALRKARSVVSMTLSSPKGLFRLASRINGAAVVGAGFRNISFPVMEAING